MFAAAPSYAAAPPCLDRAFAREVAAGLSVRRKTLPPSWLYDAVGSALFEVITLLPEYGLTRADAALLQNASDEIAAAAGEPAVIVELGSGTGAKTRHILDAASAARPIRYLPIDISRAALRNCEAALQAMDRVSIEPIEATYLEGIDLALARRHSGERALILFLGSTIGNFTRVEASVFLHRIRQRMQQGDSLLLGADLVKDTTTLLRAYDDPLGVTAAFNLNLLARINRELGGRFDLAQFAHEARYNERLSRIEMHLRSRVAQRVPIDALDLTVSFARGETIWTESSHKFRAREIRRMGERAGWRMARQWIDSEWGFAETLFLT
ncbi:MAG: L-histidine N(alpha)-methyltransferase [Bryobacteraceae bacterium]|jgi:dimethylhistidine N-methyltransferase